MIKYIKEDIFKSDIDVLIHGCNCFHTMGAGIAKTVKKYYPLAYEIDKQCSIYGDKNKLGSFTSVVCDHVYYPQNKIRIVNAYTQYRYGRGKDLFEYDHFENFCKLSNIIFKYDIVGFPKIGAGLGGGDWKKIENIINESFDKEVYVFQL